MRNFLKTLKIQTNNFFTSGKLVENKKGIKSLNKILSLALMLMLIPNKSHAEGINDFFTKGQKVLKEVYDGLRLLVYPIGGIMFLWNLIVYMKSSSPQKIDMAKSNMIKIGIGIVAFVGIGAIFKLFEAFGTSLSDGKAWDPTNI